MTPEVKRAAEALQAPDATLDTARRERLLAEVHRAHQRRQAARVIGALAVAAAAIAAVVAFTSHTPDAATAPESPPVATVTPTSVTPLVLADGSTVHLHDPSARVVVRRVTDREVGLDLESGGARFEVTPDPSRRFRLRAGAVTVEVLGTIFDVTHIDDVVEVSVTRGRVAVRWPGGGHELSAGERIRIGDEPAPSAASASAQITPAEPDPQEGGDVATAENPDAIEVARAARGGARDGARTPETAELDWRAPARGGDYGAAYEALEQQGGEDEIGVDVADLMLAADVLRLSGHPARAVPILSTVMREHATDPRAPLAAFTMGRVLLGRLGRPADAAAAFAECRRLEPQGSLAADALAREAEARRTAGDEPTASARAREYLSAYPNGRRVEQMRSLAGPEAETP